MDAVTRRFVCILGLLAAGCVWVDYLASLPPSLPDRAPRSGDEAFRFVTGRRPVIEAVIAAAAQEQPGVVVRRGVRVTGRTGFAAVGDAWACTNPSAGRGLSVGIVHAQLLRKTARAISMTRQAWRGRGRRAPSGWSLRSTSTRSGRTAPAWRR